MPTKDEKARRKQVAAELARTEQAARAAGMPLDRPQLEALLAHLEGQVDGAGCDHSTSATQAWAREQDVEVPRLLRGLAEYGGYCDCEIVMNIDPGDVFVPVRQAPQAV
jgi:hypothetical protein